MSLYNTHVRTFSLAQHLIFYSILCQTRLFLPTDIYLHRSTFDEANRAKHSSNANYELVVCDRAQSQWEQKSQGKSVSNLINSNLTFYRTRSFEWRWWWCWERACICCALKIIIINKFIPSFYAVKRFNCHYIFSATKVFACVRARVSLLLLFLLFSYLFAYFSIFAKWCVYDVVFALSVCRQFVCSVLFPFFNMNVYNIYTNNNLREKFLHEAQKPDQVKILSPNYVNIHFVDFSNINISRSTQINQKQIRVGIHTHDMQKKNEEK